MSKVTTKFDRVIDFMEREACEDIISHDPEKRNLLLKAYNRYQEENCDCADYIYDSNNNEDMIALLKGGFSMWEIVKVLYDEFPYIVIKPKGDKYVLRSINGSTLEHILGNSMKEVMECVIVYAPYCEEYMEVYKEYISNRFEPNCENYIS